MASPLQWGHPMFQELAEELDKPDKFTIVLRAKPGMVEHAIGMYPA